MSANEALTSVVRGPRARILHTVRLGLALIFIAAVGLGSCICALDH